MKKNKKQPYTFDLDAQHLDAIRSLLLAAQAYHLDRARELRTMRLADHLHAQIQQEQESARQARMLWALLAGVTSATMTGESPVGHHTAAELLRFLGG